MSISLKFKFSVYGDTVNIAARIEKASTPCKMCVSRAVHDLIGGEDETEQEEKKMISIKKIGEVEAQ